MAHYVYVLVSADNPRYAAMCLLSALSIRAVDDKARISVLADETTALWLSKQRHRLLDAIDHVVPVAVAGSPIYISRYLKTTLNRHIQGSFIYLDVDTLAARPLADRLKWSESLQLALDRYVRHPHPEFPKWVKPHYQQLGWRYPTANYYNGGVMYVHDNADTGQFFEEWHRRWNDFCKSAGRCNDQPALNSAIDITGVTIATLPIKYNAMIRVKESYRWGAKLLHLFADDKDAAADQGSEYHHLLLQAEQNQGITAEQVHQATLRRWPLVEPWSIRRHILAGNLAGAAKLWWTRKANGHGNNPRSVLPIPGSRISQLAA